VRTSFQTSAQVYLRFYILRQLSGLAYRLLRALIMAESSEKDYFDTGKLIIEVENTFWDMHLL
jgi:hypothetical protein